MWQNMKIPWIHVYIYISIYLSIYLFIYLFDICTCIIPFIYLRYPLIFLLTHAWYIYIYHVIYFYIQPPGFAQSQNSVNTRDSVRRQTTGRTWYSIVFLRVLTRTSCFYISYGIKHTVMMVSFTVSRRYQNPSVHGTVNNTIIGVSKSPGPMAQLTIQSLELVLGFQEGIKIIMFVIIIIIIIIIVILACPDAHCKSGQASGSCHTFNISFNMPWIYPWFFFNAQYAILLTIDHENMFITSTTRARWVAEVSRFKNCDAIESKDKVCL